MDHREKLDLFINDLMAACEGRIKSIILSGSVLKGTYTQESDIDLMILVNEKEPLLLEHISGLIFSEKFNSDPVLSVNIETVSEFMNSLMNGEKFIVNMVCEGECQLNSKVFEGLKTIVNHSEPPRSDDVCRFYLDDTSKRIKQYDNYILKPFVENSCHLIQQFLYLKMFAESTVNTWTQLYCLNDMLQLERAVDMYLPDSKQEILNLFRYRKHKDTEYGVDLHKISLIVDFIQHEINAQVLIEA